jgi:hypothetical protein
MSESSKKTIKSQEPSRVWIIGTNGKPSMSATFATVAFVTTTVVYIASIFEKIGPFSIRPFDPSVCAAYLTPVLALYFGRKHTDAHAPQASTPTPEAPAGQ